MQRCSKCKNNMEPRISLDGATADIFRRLATETETMVWVCPKCKIERGARLSQADIADIQAYVRRKKKAWWQFWV